MQFAASRSGTLWWFRYLAPLTPGRIRREQKHHHACAMQDCSAVFEWKQLRMTQRVVEELLLCGCVVKPPAGEQAALQPRGTSTATLNWNFTIIASFCVTIFPHVVRSWGFSFRRLSVLSVSVPPGSDPSSSTTTRGWFRRKPVHHRLAGAQRSNYDLRERICIGSMTALETAVYQQVPTDEAEAQMLASADLDDMKSKEMKQRSLYDQQVIMTAGWLLSTGFICQLCWCFGDFGGLFGQQWRTYL